MSIVYVLCTCSMFNVYCVAFVDRLKLNNSKDAFWNVKQIWNEQNDDVKQ